MSDHTVADLERLLLAMRDGRVREIRAIERFLQIKRPTQINDDGLPEHAVDWRNPAHTEGGEG